ncbi:hypothetical protein GcM3_050030 [Golovinomyces cichoracearum]|uniref:Reverse transcriptase domain-containing protein n=1 Tax=Golovinomyces cichoracearum TaxID=62708 RepID=A0A420IZK1_9PEZI|nr:hypothetical protein GcM3_050030 [Golovinomyces cichoracearum]
MTAAEEWEILLWVQMGARKNRSTLSALELLTSTVQTAWKANPGRTVSMLSLDFKGAYDNVSAKRLLWFTGYTSDWIQLESGIPQGSHLSPILFLFYIAKLLESLRNSHDNHMAFGFVDDTTIVAWGKTVHDNCKSLERAHKKCFKWASRYGSTFAPEKYQLVHFSRRAKTEDLLEGVNTLGLEVKPQAEHKVLGIIVDRQLRCGLQIKHAASKGETAFNALSRITLSVWGPSLRKSRLIYSAVVRPKMLYGSQISGFRNDGGIMSNNMVNKFSVVQNKCLRKITGGYKRTPISLLERKADVVPIDIYIRSNAMINSKNTEDKPVTSKIDPKMEELRRHFHRACTKQHKPRPKTPMESIRTDATKIQSENRNGNQCKSQTIFRRWANTQWHHRWIINRKNSTATTWMTPWKMSPLKLYDGLKKYEATALMLLRSEIPGINRQCTCGEHSQTVKHILLYCPEHTAIRAQMISKAKTSLYDQLLATKRSCCAAAKILIKSHRLHQFSWVGWL